MAVVADCPAPKPFKSAMTFLANFCERLVLLKFRHASGTTRFALAAASG
jgi:hypothetical protein